MSSSSGSGRGRRMDVAHKAPPQKRRRLSSDTSIGIRLGDETTTQASYSRVADYPYTYLLPVPPRGNSRRLDEAHVHVHLHPMSPQRAFDILPRQGSSSSAGDVSTGSSTTGASDEPPSSGISFPRQMTSSGSPSGSTPVSTTATPSGSSTTPNTRQSSSTNNEPSPSATPSSSPPAETSSSSSTTPSNTSTSSSSSISSTSTSATSPISSSTTSSSSSSTPLSTSSTSSTTTATTTSSSSSSSSTPLSSSSSSSSSSLSSTSSSTITTTSTSFSSSTSSSDSLRTSTFVKTIGGKVSTITSIYTGAGDNRSDLATSSTSSTSTGLAVPNSNNNSSSPPPGTIAGGVVGGAAGLAVVVLIAMLLVRWYRRKSEAGHLALPPGAATAPEPEEAYRSPGPGMAERAGLMPFASHMPNFLRHQNRSVDDSEPSERGFRRVSGKKLPSAFSEGMSSSGPSTVPLRSEHSHTMSSGAPTFYRDNADPFYGEPREEWTSLSPVTHYGPGEDHELMTMSPGPERTPNIQHTTRDYYRAPRRASDGRFGSSPPVAGAATRFARSDTSSSVDPSRNSRFTEEM